jgi:hypothetical protein
MLQFIVASRFPSPKTKRRKKMNGTGFGGSNDVPYEKSKNQKLKSLQNRQMGGPAPFIFMGPAPGAIGGLAFQDCDGAESEANLGRELSPLV